MLDLKLTVVHTLAPEVLELFTGLIQNRNNAPSVPAVTQQPVTEKPVTEKPVTEKPKPKATHAGKAEVEATPQAEAPAEPEAPKDEAPATTGKAYTLEEVRAAAVAKTREGDAKRDAVKALITEYGATAISTLDKGHYGEFMTKLNAI